MRKMLEKKFPFEQFYSFSDKKKLEHLIYHASLAPSSHNTQPWIFRVEKSSIEIKPNLDRKLPHSDPQGRQLYLSIGAAVGNLELAAKSFGLMYEKKYIQTTEQIETVFTFSNLSSQQKIPDSQTLQSIFDRHNNRSFYSDQKIPDDFNKKIQSFLNDGISLFLINDDNTKEKIRQLIILATKQAFGNKNFTRELSEWMHPSLKKYHDGFVGYNLGIPWLISFIFPFIIRYLPMAEQQAKMENAVLKNSASYGILTTPEDTPLYWLITGEIYEKIAVEAQKKGIKTAVLGAPIEIGEHYKNLQSILKTTERPLLFFRMGYSKNIPKKSPRKDINEIIIS